MAKGKKYVYIQLYSKDLLADEKLAKCDKASAWGAYLALLNIMAMEPVRGCLRLRDWDTHPENARKSLVANFRRANTLRAKAAAFARIVVQCTPLKLSPIAEGIEQLLTFGVIVMHDDAIIQPRMFRESRSQLEGYTPEPEPEEEIVTIGDNSTAADRRQNNKTATDTCARALRANTRDSITEREYENKDNSSIGGAGGSGAVVGGAVVGETPGGGETAGSTPDDGFDEFWRQYDKHYADGRRISQTGAKDLWRALGDDERLAAMDFLPQYVAATPTKQYRMHPYRYLKERAWLTIKINGGRVEDGEPTAKKRPVGDNPPSLDDIQAYCDERREQQKPFLYITAEEFLDICTVSNWTRGKKNEPIYDWKAYLRQCDLYRQRHGDVQVGQSSRQQDKSSRIGKDAAVPASTTHEGKYKKRM